MYNMRLLMTTSRQFLHQLLIKSSMTCISSSLLDMPAPYLSKHDIDRLMLVIPLYVYFDKEEWPNIYRIEMMDDGWEELYNYYSLRYKTEFLGEDLGSDMLERPANNAASTSACASDPKNEVRSKIEINNVGI